MSSGRRIAMLLAVGGAGACVVALVHFVLTILNNDLPWSNGQSAREFYVAMGRSYTQGFVVGFFFCFSLSVAAVAIGTWKGRTAREGGARSRSGPSPSAADGLVGGQ